MTCNLCDCYDPTTMPELRHECGCPCHLTLHPGKGAFYYGASRYSIHDGNLALLGIDRAELTRLLEPLMKRLDKLSGGHRLDRHPMVHLGLFGNGYSVEFSEEL